MIDKEKSRKVLYLYRMRKIIVTETQVKNLYQRISEQTVSQPLSYSATTTTKNPGLSAIQSMNGQIISEYNIGGNIKMQVINANGKRIYVLKNNDLYYGSFTFANPGYPIKQQSSIIYTTLKSMVIASNAKKMIKLYLNPSAIVHLYEENPAIQAKFDPVLKPLVKQIYANINGSDKSVAGKDDMTYQKFRLLF